MFKLQLLNAAYNLRPIFLRKRLDTSILSTFWHGMKFKHQGYPLTSEVDFWCHRVDFVTLYKYCTIVTWWSYLSYPFVKDNHFFKFQVLTVYAIWNSRGSVQPPSHSTDHACKKDSTCEILRYQMNLLVFIFFLFFLSFLVSFPVLKLRVTLNLYWIYPFVL